MKEKTDSELLDLDVEVPESVVVRSFAEQTVALNVRSGAYHGLNPVAALMLERLQECDRAGDAVPGLAAEFSQPEELIRTDLANLLRGLLERGLVEARTVDPTG